MSLFELMLVSDSSQAQAHTLPLDMRAVICSFGSFQCDKALSSLVLLAFSVLTLFLLMQRQIISPTAGNGGL